MKWTLDKLGKDLNDIMSLYDLSEIPSRQYLDGIERQDIVNGIARYGGFKKLSRDLGIPCRSNGNKVWTEESIEKALIQYIDTHDLKRMPSKPDLINSGEGALGNALTRHKGMKWWADKIGVELKESETKTGNTYEYLAMKKIEDISNHLSVEKMSSKHPYDLLVNGCVKVDVKVGRAHRHFEARAHTFALNKKYATCDIYVCVALDEENQVEKCFIIPAAHVQIVTLNIGRDSKYNKYMDNWNFIYNFANAYESAIS